MSGSINFARSFQQQLQDYLTERFGSTRLAQTVAHETVQTLDGSPILDAVGDPEIYMRGYALSLALKLNAEAES
ncbi:hypothetical protein [Gilvimarinus algae]|uniref:Uncharacterized protein n=1 Tax=Gilvimarinus algae TaxID=3058037 RepID=A0ABT8TCT9_9GAMM|nr:hypothetical protein [Gilvimarinus sp. SDUM040014]MDO3381922.1 hypothetical protein [Gilvimarinus sp. SDUM040014]